MGDDSRVDTMVAASLTDGRGCGFVHRQGEGELRFGCVVG